MLAYKRCFSTASGMAVLADLKERFAFDRWPAETGLSAGTKLDDDVILRRVFAMGPLFHIEKQLKTIFRDGKPKRPARQASP